MSIIVTDTGFRFAQIQPDHETLDLKTESQELMERDILAAIIARVDTPQRIRITFSSFTDGRGFTIARQLRLLGFAGHLRAVGPILADQYAMARRAGFDDVEISDARAVRQPWPQWQFRANWQAYDYQSRLRCAS
ncbi:MAG: DUF934 domain-containing protein [Rhodobacterales bacterium]|nr:DUF934 domain-containing protein [Rhodobacterales bacterium]